MFENLNAISINILLVAHFLLRFFSQSIACNQNSALNLCICIILLYRLKFKKKGEVLFVAFYFYCFKFEIKTLIKDYYFHINVCVFILGLMKNKSLCRKAKINTKSLNGQYLI